MPGYPRKLDWMGAASSLELDGSSARLVLGGLDKNLSTLVLICRSLKPSQYPVHGWLPMHCSMKP
jgi:hypothetical protein